MTFKEGDSAESQKINETHFDKEQIVEMQPSERRAFNLRLKQFYLFIKDM